MAILNGRDDVTYSKNLSKKAVEFGIKVDGVSFKLITEKLYNDPIKSFVRELLSNAFDSQVEANTQHIPIYIKIPTSNDNMFVLRDYGTGLSEENMYKIYSTMFYSTKRESNDFQGAFGLGSKSPLSYTDSYFIESFYNGIKSEYLIFKNEDDIPCIKKMCEEETGELNGLKISIAIGESDYRNITEHVRFYAFYSDFKFDCNIDLIDIDKRLVLKVGNVPYRSYDYQNILEYNLRNKINNYSLYSSIINIVRDNYTKINHKINIPIGLLSFSTSRDDIIVNDENTKIIDNEINKVVDVVYNIVLKINNFIENTSFKDKHKYLYRICRMLNTNYIDICNAFIGKTEYNKIELSMISVSGTKIGKLSRLWNSANFTYKLDHKNNKIDMIDFQEVVYTENFTKNNYTLKYIGNNKLTLLSDEVLEYLTNSKNLILNTLIHFNHNINTSGRYIISQSELNKIDNKYTRLRIELDDFTHITINDINEVGNKIFDRDLIFKTQSDSKVYYHFNDEYELIKYSCKEFNYSVVNKKLNILNNISKPRKNAINFDSKIINFGDKFISVNELDKTKLNILINSKSDDFNYKHIDSYMISDNNFKVYKVGETRYNKLLEMSVNNKVTDNVFIINTSRELISKVIFDQINYNHLKKYIGLLLTNVNDYIYNSSKNEYISQSKMYKFEISEYDKGELKSILKLISVLSNNNYDSDYIINNIYSMMESELDKFNNEINFIIGVNLVLRNGLKINSNNNLDEYYKYSKNIKSEVFNRISKQIKSNLMISIIELFKKFSGGIKC